MSFVFGGGRLAKTIHFLCQNFHYNWNQKCTIQQNYVMNESNSKGEDSCDSALPRICIPNDSTCAICLSNYEEDQIVVKSPNDPCTHLFHFDCMKQWIEKTAADDCPCCRRNFVQQI